MHEESQSPSFVEDLHKVAMTFDAPNTELLYGSAVHRGRAIKRRRAFQGALAAVVALVVAGSLLTLAGGTKGHAVPSASSMVTRPSSSDGPVSGKYMLESFKALLPGDVKIDPTDGMATLYGVSYAIYGTDGSWSARAYAFTKIDGYQENVQLSVDRPAYVMTTCALDDTGAKIGCKTTSLGGGAKLVTYTSATENGSELDVYRNLPDGVDVHLQVQGTAPVGHPVMTESQMLALVTAPAWDEVIADMPAKIDCPSGIQPQNGGRGPDWVCTGTGKIYPAGPSVDSDTNLG